MLYPSDIEVVAPMAVGALPQFNPYPLAQQVLPFPNEIIPGFLFLGNIHQAAFRRMLRDMGTTHVVRSLYRSECVI